MLARGEPLGALCSGAYALATAGFLGGRRSAIHWESHDAFAEEFPRVALARGVFVEDEPILTAPGGHATADLMLSLITERPGENLARVVADQRVDIAVREGSAEQRVSLQARSGARNARLVKAIDTMRRSIEDPLRTSEITSSAGVTPSQLERLSGKYLKITPKEYMLELRLHWARQLLLRSELSVLEAALACGCENSGHFARLCRTAFSVAPTRQSGRIS